MPSRLFETTATPLGYVFQLLATDVFQALPVPEPQRCRLVNDIDSVAIIPLPPGGFIHSLAIGGYAY
jgi:hypothetical protein